MIYEKSWLSFCCEPFCAFRKLSGKNDHEWLMLMVQHVTEVQM